MPSDGVFKPPVEDHTTSSGSGHYMLVDHSHNLFGESAILKGPKFGRTKELCTYRFWYHMQGDQDQQLSVFNMVSAFQL